MRAPVAIALSLVCAALALAPRSAAQENLAEMTLAALEGGGPESLLSEAPSLLDAFADRPAVGVLGSAALRMSPPPRELFVPKPKTVPFAEQADSGLRVFHLPVFFDDPSPSADAPFAAAGLRIRSADDDDLCVTLMLCLTQLDRLARDADAPLVVVVDAGEPSPAPASLAVRAARAVPTAVQGVLGYGPAAQPAWDVMVAEVAAALPDLDPARLIVVLAGGAGEPPDPVSVLGDAAAAVLLDGADARLLRADAAPEAVAEAVMSGALTVVVGADWTGEGDPGRLGPREAAQLGAHAVIVTPESARQGGLGG
jgi:hypothetical protein